LRIIFPQSSTVCAPGSDCQSHKSGDKTCDGHHGKSHFAQRTFIQGRDR
jgi:hypothetical protein